MPDLSNHVRRGHPIAFGIITFISLIVAIIASVLTSDYNNNGEQGPDVHSNGLVGRVRFLVFVGWWSFVFSIIYLALFLTGVGGVVTSIAGHGIWLLITFIFYLAGAAALADQLGSSCGDQNYYYCNSLRALEAFSWINAVLLFLMIIVVGLIGGGAFRGGRGLKDGLSQA